MSKPPFVAIQIGPISFLDEGVEPVLDFLKEEARVNALFLVTHSFDPGTASRQIKGHPFPDHGKKVYDTLRGGTFTTPHMQYYSDTSLRGFRSTDYGSDYDVLASVAPAAAARGIAVYSWVTESPNYNLPAIFPGFSRMLEVGTDGMPIGQPCLNNPDYRNFYLDLYEDTCASYSIQGIALCSERKGAFASLFGRNWGSRGLGCFCPECCRLGRDAGIPVQKAKEGLSALQTLITRAGTGAHFSDGAFTECWRLLLRYPEVLAWEQLYAQSQQRFFRDLYARVKLVAPDTKVGWHIMHLNSLDPLYSAEQDYPKMAPYTDFLKLALYQNCAPERFERLLGSLTGTTFGDVSPGNLRALFYDLLRRDRGPEQKAGDPQREGFFDGKWVRGEVARAKEALPGQDVAVYAGIGIDVPVGSEDDLSTEAQIEEGIRGAFAGGADGIVLSRKYSEMRLSNLRTAGRVLKSYGC